jgi:hypothetical protein
MDDSQLNFVGGFWREGWDFNGDAVFGVIPIGQGHDFTGPDSSENARHYQILIDLTVAGKNALSLERSAQH